MRVIVQVHTFNDEEVIDRLLQALAAQTYRFEEIVLVDNGSQDETLRHCFRPNVKVIPVQQNRGTSGSTCLGIQFAVDNHYDWIWVLDADSLPRPDALAKLVELHDSFDPAARARLGVLSSAHHLLHTTRVFQGRRLTPGGPRWPKIDPGKVYCECDSTIWSGSLFNLQAVKAVGMPRWGPAGCWDDLSLDYGDVEYSYRIKRAGYRVLVHRYSMVDHPVGNIRSATTILGSTNHACDRRYLYFRNMMFFWLYLYPRIRPLSFLAWFLYRFTMTTVGILLSERDRFRKIKACSIGIVDGWNKSLSNRFAG